MALSRKQMAAIAMIVAAGLVAEAAILVSAPKPADGDGEQGHSHSRGDDHDRADEHGDDHAGADHAGADHNDADHAAASRGSHGDEDRIGLTPAQIEAAGIVVEEAGSAEVLEAQAFPGEIRFNEDRTAHIVPRLAGVVEKVSADLGQQVRKGQVLAVLASTALADQRSELLIAQKRLEFARTSFEREKRLWQDRISAEQDYLQSRRDLDEARIAVRNANQKLAAIGAAASATGLNRLELRAPFDGMIVAKHLALGEAVREDASIFTLSDLGSVWAEFVVSPKDLARLRVGNRVTVTSTAFDSTAEGTVSYVGSLVGEQTRTATARATLANPQLAWRPGLFVTVEVATGEFAVPVAVRADAVQSIENRDVVFVEVPGGFVARPVKLGRSDGKFVEVMGGLNAGARYAATHTFVLKSELGKSSATHVH